MIWIILFSCFFIRAVPRLILKDVYSSDTYFHLYCAKVIRENRFRLPSRLLRVILNHEYTYPFGYHLLLAFFPVKMRLWVERLTGAIFDTLSAIVIYLFSEWAVHYYSLKFPELPILVTALFTFSPALLRLGSGPRAYNGSPRVMGQTLYLLHITTGYYALVTHNLPALIISLLACAVLIITAKFAIQVILFFGIFLSIFISNYYILLILVGLFLSILLSGGRAWQVLKGHSKHSVFYVKYVQKVFLWPNVRTFKQYFSELLSSIGKMLSQGSPKIIMQWYYKEQYFLHIFLTVYPQFLLFFTFFRGYGETNDIERFLIVWMGAGLFLFFFTKIKWFMFLGEGERYLEYALFPSLFVLVNYLMDHNQGIIYGFLIYSVISAAFYFNEFYNRFRKDNYDFKLSSSFFEKIQNISPGVIWPIGSFHYQTLYRLNLPVLSHGANIDENMLSREEFMFVYGQYPYPSENFNGILERYNVAYIISEKNSIRYYLDTILKTSEEFNRLTELMFESNSLNFYKVVR